MRKEAAVMSSRPKKRRPLLRILGCLLILILVAAAFFIIAPLTENGKEEAAAGSADWMASLDDALSLSETRLPGTHDSATKYCQLAYVTKCQKLTIGEQLEAGFRYLDIRLGVDGARMVLMHGFTYCKTGPFPWSEKLSLESVLADCYAFLKAHPTETVLFAVKQEHGDESVADFQKLLDQTVAAGGSHWLLTDRLPTLGEARGKLVLLRRYDDAAKLGKRAGIPLLWADQGGHDNVSLNTVSSDNGSYTLWVQDRYEYDADDKWAAFTAGLAAAKAGKSDAAVHFLSTKGTFVQGHPFAFAKDLNARLSAESLPAAGWIVIDFGTPSLAAHIAGY